MSNRKEVVSFRIAHEHLRAFFKNRKYHLGGEIPENLLLSKNSIDFLLNTDFDSGIDYCYSKITPQFNDTPLRFPDDLAWDIRVVVKLGRDAGALGIPICYRAGLILLYFKFCQGAKGVCRKKYSNWIFARELFCDSLKAS